MARNLIDGQKAGSGSPRQPVIAPDSASSITKLKMAVGLSEGEIEGFGRADIKLDGTPLSSLSSDIICDYRFGTNNQEYINGVDEVANEIGVGVELSTDWVKLITNSDIDHIGIRLRWGPLQTSHTNGDVSGVSITYEIHIAAVGGSYERVLATTLSDKTSDSYERYHEFKLPESDDGWMVKVVRVTPSAQSSLISDKMYVQAYSEIIKSKFTFPHTSLVYLEYDAKTFSNVAKLAVNAKGLIIRVPSNYDPVTRQYSGLWNGVFKMAYSNNPAWVYYDLVTNPRYGCGDRIDQSMVDKWSLYRLAQYCDQMVDDGYGGLEPRFTCNVYLQSKERAYDILNRLTGLFRAINFWNGSQLVVDADIPQDTSYLYTNANVVDGLFEYSGTAATDQYSAAKVAWDNPANGYNTEYEAVSYEHLVKKLGFKVLELDAWGCTSRGQALRAGRWALLAESDTVTFKVGMDGYLAMPGKIIEIQDEFYAGKSNGGRVISVSASRLEVTLDRPVVTIAGDTISFNTTTGKVKKYNIVSSAGSVVTLSEEVDASIERMHIWAISSSQLATQKYRILTVKYDGVGEFTISAVEYNASKYEEIDSNILFDEPPTSIINPIAQDAVNNVVIDSYEFVYQGLNTVNLNIKWERAVNAVEYLVEIKKDNGSWLKLPATGNNSIELENIFAGSYIARVTAVSAFELKSLPTYSVKTAVQGKLTAPQAPLNPRVVPVLFGIEYYWDFPTNSGDIAVSRIAISYQDPTHLADESSFVIYDKAYSDNKFVLQHLDLHTRVWFKVKLIDKLGFESPYTAWVNGQPSQDVDKVLDLVSGHISESTLDQILKGKIDGALGLAGEANSLASQANTAASNAQDTATQASTKAQEAANAVVQEAIDRAAALQDGITQVTTDYRAEDAVVLGELNAYKVSNDSAMATVVQKAESAVAAGSTNSQAITELTGEVQAINDTKLDASVISNYYTKGQADDKSAEIAAGQITAFEATLALGGGWMDIGREGAQSVIENGAGTIEVIDRKLNHFKITVTSDGWLSAYIGACNNSSAIPVGTPYVMTGKVRASRANLYDRIYARFNQYSSESYVYGQNASSDWVSFKASGVTNTQEQNSIYNIIGALVPNAVAGDWVEFKDCRIAVNSDSVTSANANAIQTVNAEVARVNGEVISTVNSVNNLSSNVGLLQGNINEVRQTVTNNQESTNTLVTSLRSGMADADDLSMMMRNATVLQEDLNFREGYNGVNVYNNYENGALAFSFTDRLPDNPAASTRQLQFIHSGGATTPSLGGFHQSVQSRASGVFLIKFVAKLPVGYSFGLAANAYGDGASDYFIGSSEGTGKFKTYYGVYRCGATGNFSTVGFVYANGPQPSPENPLVWYLASSTVYDCLDSKVAPDSVINGIAEAKSTASTAVNKAEATALLAQNLQTALDNTNADISNNYYTRSQADTATAGHISSYDANLVIGGTNLLLNSDFSGEASWYNWSSNGGGYTKVSDPTYGTVLQTELPSGLVHNWVKLENNVEYTYSALVKPSNNLYQTGNTPLHYWAGKDNQHQGKIHVLSYSPTLIEAGKWTRISIVFKLIDDADSFRPYIFGGAGALQLAWTKLERGNKATDWSPNSVEMQHSINANASAVQSTKAEVLRIDGIVTSQASQIVTLESSKSAIENGGIAGNNEYIVDLRDPAYNRDLYYPVLLSNFSTELRQTIRVSATLDGVSVPSWSYHGGGFSLNAQFQMGGAGWGTIDPEIVTDNFSFAYARWDVPPLDQIGQITASSQPFFYVRGGGYYRLSKPVNRSVQVCAPNGSLSGYFEGTLNPRPYQESTVPKSINQGLNQQNVKLQQTNTVLDGVKAISTVTIDNNGVMSGYGLISELVNGQVRSSFGVNANTFYIGSPSLDKKPFVQRNDWSVINGVWVPPGTYIDTAFIGAATIGNAHINDLAVTTAKIGDGQITNAKIGDAQITTAKIGDGQITNAKIGDAQITTAKIGDLQVNTLKIKDNAVTIGVSANNVKTLSIVTEGGKVLVTIGIQAYIAGVNQNGTTFTLKRNGSVVNTWAVRPTGSELAGMDSYYIFSACSALPPFTDSPPAGTHTYTFETGIWSASMITASMSLLETKK